MKQNALLKLAEKQGVFPKDAYQLMIEHKEIFEAMSSAYLADFIFVYSNFCELIDGTSSYVFMGKLERIPQAQINLLKPDFFQTNDEYIIIKELMATYPLLWQDYVIHEEMRQILLELLQDKIK